MSSVRITVDAGVCQLNGKCVERAPEVFQLDGGDVVSYRTEVSEPESVEAVLDAEFLCPMQAIEVDDGPPGA